MHASRCTECCATLLPSTLRCVQGSGCAACYQWSNFTSVQEIVGTVHDFNVRSFELGVDCGLTVAAGMKTIFDICPCPDEVTMWKVLSE